MRDKQEKPILGDDILHSRPPGYWTVKYVVCAIHNYTTTVTDLIQYTYYRNSLYFRCKNIFVHRKRTKIFYANIRKFFRRWLALCYTPLSPALPELLLPIYPCIRTW